MIFKLVPDEVKEKYTSVKFSVELLEKLKSIAKENNITFSDIVNQCCEFALQNMEK